MWSWRLESASLSGELVCILFSGSFSFLSCLALAMGCSSLVFESRRIFFYTTTGVCLACVRNFFFFFACLCFVEWSNLFASASCFYYCWRACHTCNQEKRRTRPLDCLQNGWASSGLVVGWNFFFRDTDCYSFDWRWAWFLSRAWFSFTFAKIGHTLFEAFFLVVVVLPGLAQIGLMCVLVVQSRLTTHEIEQFRTLKRRIVLPASTKSASSKSERWSNFVCFYKCLFPDVNFKSSSMEAGDTSGVQEAYLGVHVSDTYEQGVIVLWWHCAILFRCSESRGAKMMMRKGCQLLTN